MKKSKLRNILSISLLLVVTTFTLAQNASIILEINNSNNEPLPYTNVEVYNGKNALNISGTTDEKGIVRINSIPYGKVKIVASSPGFIDFIKEFDINQLNQNLGKIKLSNQDSNTLKTVSVRAETSIYRTEIDKRVVDVGKDLVSAGANVADVLNNIPSLSVDGQSGELTLRGNENVKVFVDGKPSNIPTAQLLKQLPSSSISKIEIITQPSAKYDPDGNSGIINIVTIKSKRAGYTIGVDLGYTIGKQSRHNSSINGNYNTGKFNFFGNYSNNTGKNEIMGDITNFDIKKNQNFTLLNKPNSNNFKAGLDYFINDKTALTIYTNQNFYKEISLGNFKINDLATPTIIENNITNDDLDNHNQDYSLNFKKEFKDTDNYIELDALYSQSNDSNDSYFNNETPILNTFTQESDDTRKNTRLNLNYSNKIEKFGKIEAGLQYRQEKTEDNFFTDEIQTYIDPNTNTTSTLQIGDRYFNWTRNIYSAFANYNNKFGQFGVQLGLRAENVKEDGIFRLFNTPIAENSTIKNSYTQLYPSAYFTYDIGKKTTLSLNYSRRIDRPRIGQISPIREWNSPLISSYGNPDLKPQFTNSFEFALLKKYKNGTLNFNIFYRKIDDQFFRSLRIDSSDPNRTILGYTNYDHSDSYGLEISSNYKFTKWWNINASFDIFNNKIQDGTREKDSRPWNARINNNFKMGKNFSIQHFTMYRGKFEFSQGTLNPMWKMDLGVRYTILDGKGTFTARVSDIFKTFFVDLDITNPQLGEGKIKWEAHTLYVGFSYNFGGKVKARTDKHQNNEQQSGGAGVGF